MKILLKAQVFEVPDTIGKTLVGPVGGDLHAHVGRNMSYPILGFPIEFEEIKERKLEEAEDAETKQERSEVQRPAEGAEAQAQDQESEARSADTGRTT